MSWGLFCNELGCGSRSGLFSWNRIRFSKGLNPDPGFPDDVYRLGFQKVRSGPGFSKVWDPDPGFKESRSGPGFHYITVNLYCICLSEHETCA